VYWIPKKNFCFLGRECFSHCINLLSKFLSDIQLFSIAYFLMGYGTG
jgi:hypothetical protein